MKRKENKYIDYVSRIYIYIGRVLLFLLQKINKYIRRRRKGRAVHDKN